MFYFPQLSTGAIGQYPIQKRRLTRTVINEATDGVMFKLADTNAAAVEWTLQFTTLSDDESNALALLHDNVEGQLGSFTFLDPTDNLLLWSEKLDPIGLVRANSFLTIAGGVADPDGGTSATQLSNTGSAALSAQQIVNGPGWFQYAFSVQVRSDSNQAGDFDSIHRDGRLSRRHSTSVRYWTRIVLSGNFAGTDESVTFGIQLPPGGSVRAVWGPGGGAARSVRLQADAVDSAGVYPNGAIPGRQPLDHRLTGPASTPVRFAFTRAHRTRAMPTIFQQKEQTATETPILLFDCVLSDGTVERWSTHTVVVSGVTYQPRVLMHNLFQMQTSSDMGVDTIPKISVTLANADSHFSEIERSVGCKGAVVTVSFLFYQLKNGVPDTESMVLFKGIANPPDEIQRGDLPAHAPSIG